MFKIVFTLIFVYSNYYRKKDIEHLTLISLSVLKNPFLMYTYTIQQNYVQISNPFCLVSALILGIGQSENFICT